MKQFLPSLIILIFLNLISEKANSQNYNFLGSYTADGTPEYLENPSDVVSQETIDRIKSALPESYPVPDYNPHYISSGYDTDIHLKDSAAVYVSFVSEGASYKNVLGFYTYQTDNPSLTTPTKEDITIIFPNVSALYSGGSLLPGDKVKIGDFKAGTSIGWVLLANGWKGSVTSGLWQVYSNPDYNPEAYEDLRNHNVLLADDENQRVILGFEDIRRDYANCDHDFNDAIFYVTANPYEAIMSENLTKVEEATDVTSANDGGLESNGSLAEKIAKRNFTRSVNHNNANTKDRQTKMQARATISFSTEDKNTLQDYIPSTGMYGTESSYISSPTDLIDITNAQEVFSTDYYQGEHRIAAVLASYTTDKVYDHTKSICDRLNNSSLEDVRLVKVRGHQIIYSKIVRESGEVENTLSFSIQKNTDNAGVDYELHSYWSIDQYPAGSYYNFQIWGGSNSQVFALANQILDKFSEEGVVQSDDLTEKIPNVFVKSGYYQNGNIYLELINNTQTTAITLEANYKATEHSELQTFDKKIVLSGNRHDAIVVDSGNLFDAGISISSENSEQIDALYLADGPWGIDYLDESATVSMYDIEQSKTQSNANAVYNVERNLFVSGNIKNTFNAFRQVLAGDQSFELGTYNAIEFTTATTHAIELILMQNDLSDWENRYSYTIPANEQEQTYTIEIKNFTDKNGNSANINDVKRIVFSLNGNGVSLEPFKLIVNDISFTNANTNDETLNIEEVYEQNLEVSESVYPNPFSDQTSIKVDVAMVNPTISVHSMTGNLVDLQKLQVNAGRATYTSTGLPNGIYVYTITENGKKVIGKFMIKK